MIIGMISDRRFAALGIEIPEILLPRNVDFQKWAVIACDQFTQDRGYWEQVKNAVAGLPSTLNLIFPEVYLSGEDKTARIDAVHRAMGRYLAEGIFATRRGCMYIERDTPFRRKRRGLVIAVDLEQYDWSPSARPLIRATEGTVPERLPPRMDIRRGAPLETPHILLLIDDDTDSLLTPLAERVQKTAPVYETKLMMASGGVSGWFVDAEADLSFIAEKLEALFNRAQTRYNSSNITPNKSGLPEIEAPFLFAVGDGNHSLATAKAIWEEYKKNHGASSDRLLEHPCRYALVEIENIYDPAITFEPIHRVLFGIGFDEALNLLSGLPDFSVCAISDRVELARLTAEPPASGTGNRMGAACGNRYALIETSASGLATASLQPLLDRYLDAAGKEGKSLAIDYIHGADELFRLATDSDAVKKQAVGILLPPLKKAGLFETVARTGPLPRKSFSMGEACEKRFYMECRRLF